MGIKRCSKLHKAILASAVALFMLLSGAFAYADESIETELNSFKDDCVELMLPTDAETREYLEPDHIMSAEMPVEGENDLLLDVYYTYTDCGSGYYYLSSKEEAEEYYSLHGKDAIEEFFENHDANENYTLLSLGVPEYYSGNEDTFAVVTAKVRDESREKTFCEKIYITAYTPLDYGDAVNKIFLFSDAEKEYKAKRYNAVSTYAAIEKVCMDEFYDYGQDENYLRSLDELGYDDESYSEDSGPFMAWGGALFLLFFLLVLIGNKRSAVQGQKPQARKAASKQPDAIRLSGETLAGAAKAVRNEAREWKAKPASIKAKDKSPKRTKADVDDWMRSAPVEEPKRRHAGADDWIRSTAVEKPKKAKKKAADASRWKPVRDIDSTQLAHGHVSVAVTDAEERYFESLREMQKSGLVTKEEYNEILEKYQERKEWQKR